MDFVIFGVGLGATLVLFGWLWRTVGPRLRHRAADGSVLSGEEMVASISWRRFCRSGGALWVMGGFLLVLAAYVSLLLGLSDHTGAIVVTATALAVLFAVILWLVAYLHRFGLIGLAPKREPATVPTTMPEPASQRRRSIPNMRRAPETVAANSAVLGPSVPAGIGNPVSPASTGAQTEAAASMATGEQTSGEAATAERGIERADAKPEPAAAVVGAAHRAEKQPEARNEPIERRAPHLVNAHHVARGPESRTQARGEELRPPSERGAEEAASAEAPDSAPMVGGRDEAKSDAPDVSPASAPPAGQSEAKREPNRVIPRMGSEAFRASLARQEENLARAAARGDAAGSRRSPRNAAGVADPAGVEGKDWVRSDGTQAVPDSFPVKGNARSRRYHPVGTPSYEATVADFYFASPTAAEAAGYRLPKSLQESSATGAHEAEHHP